MADDDPSIRFIVRLVLEREGHDVFEAVHGQAALDIIQAGNVPDIVATDLTMPTLTGLELIERLRAEPRTAEIPIVVISGSHETARNLRAAGLVNAVVDKPFDAAAIARCIQDMVASLTGTRQNSSSHEAA